MLRAVSVESVLNALEGVCYIAAFDGTILSVGRQNWWAAAEAGGARELKPDAIVGRNLFSFIAGEEVRHAHRGFFHDLQAGRRDEITFEYRCDSPSLRREMRMCMTAVREARRPVGVMLQSLVVNETMRPPVELFDASRMQRIQSEQRELPLITMCSYCHSVKVDGVDDAWQSAEDYYRAGGSSRVRISHGICKPCFNRVTAPPADEPAGTFSERSPH